jgi:hypothetical protein
MLVVSTVVFVPLTVKLPETVKFPPIVGLVTNPTLILLALTIVSTSFVVPSNVKVSPPAMVSFEPLSAATSNDVAIVAVETAVTRPLALTVITKSK